MITLNKETFMKDEEDEVFKDISSDEEENK